MKKKVFAAVLAAMMAFSAAGCGNTGDSSSETAEEQESSAVEITSVEDLADLKIGVQIGTTGDSQATEAVNDASQVSPFNKGADAVQALKNGKVDCVVIDSLPAEKFVEANDDLKIIDGIFETEQYAICMKKGNTELKEEFNTALAELKEEGVLDEIQSNYIGDEIGEHPYESPADADRSKGTLVMATNAEFEPWEYKEGDEIVGIDADIAQAICDKLGYELQIEDMAFEAILTSVSTGKADFGAAGMTVTPEREESVEFTDTYAEATQVVIVKK
ncbi:MAG TPA: transporter substrate-binding domain-containing protein [Candidatus Blautia merdavium]|uniref:Transporter substrate-binding domain-containing protein n=1 Tax=Candidatus Blautia merdavium TaxID=2838494 RepID=A0A9D2TAM9_9FIRM|nr:transporter substrate-binding domain-containing protein [Candidatus Blautia merdavium]